MEAGNTWEAKKSGAHAVGAPRQPMGMPGFSHPMSIGLPEPAVTFTSSRRARTTRVAQ